MILVTGGTGFLGAHLLCTLRAQGKTVRAIRRNTSSMHEFNRIFSWRFRDQSNEHAQLLAGIEWVEADLLDIPSLTLAMDGIKRVYHAAAMVSFVPRQREQMIEANVTGTANLVNLCLDMGIEKLCYVSSIAALGRAASGTQMDEKSTWEDSPLNSNYAISKYRAELEVWRAAEEGLTTVIVNPGVILGVGDPKRGSCRMLATASKKLPAYTEGVNGYVDVQDVAKAMILLMDGSVSGERFVLVSANLSFRELFHLVNTVTGNPDPKMKAPVWLTSLGWMVEWVRSKLLGRDPMITRETVRALHNRFYYKAGKIQEQADFRFTPVETTIAEAVKELKIGS